MGQTLSEPVVEKVRFVPQFFLRSVPLAFHCAFGYEHWYWHSDTGARGALFAQS